MGDLREEALRVLRKNWCEGERKGVPFAYTCPSTSWYPDQWYWDSCFTAIAWCNFDIERAHDELRTLVKAQREDGFIPHTVFWRGRVRPSRAPFYNIRKLSDPSTATIQPPLLAWAWELVAEASGAEGESFVREGIEPLSRHYEWLARERDINGEGLIAIIQPDECGLDGSPKFDSLWGWRAWGRPGQPLAVSRNRRMDFNAQRIAARYNDHVEEVLTNVMYALGLTSLARMIGDKGKDFAERASRVRRSLIERCYDESAGLFFDRVGTGEKTGRKKKRLMVNTWSSISPLVLPDLPKDIAGRLVEHLMDPAEYRTAVPIPSVAATEPSFCPGETPGPFKRYWRGATWVNTAWLIISAMRRLGYSAEAELLLEPLRKTIIREGLREYYNARTGEGLGARDFAWSTLIVELEPFQDRSESSRL